MRLLIFYPQEQSRHAPLDELKQALFTMAAYLADEHASFINSCRPPSYDGSTFLTDGIRQKRHGLALCVSLAAPMISSGFGRSHAARLGIF